ncbi:hypothetical protein OAR97_03260 [Arcobacteraceae bacterium]|nr:hypothetical protein [Arcobacteraceae bacterium]
MQEITNIKVTQYSSSSQNKKTSNSDLERTFEENLEDNMEENQEEKHEDISHSSNSARIKTLREQERRCLEIVSSKKYQEKMCKKVESYLTKKLLEERRRIKVMIQVLNDISKTFPYFLFYANINKKRKII